MGELISSAEDFLSPDTTPPAKSDPWILDKVEPNTSLLRARSAARRQWLLGPSPRFDLVSPDRRRENACLAECRDERNGVSFLFMEGILRCSSHVLGVAERFEPAREAQTHCYCKLDGSRLRMRDIHQVEVRAAEVLDRKDREDHDERLRTDLLFVPMVTDDDHPQSLVDSEQPLRPPSPLLTEEEPVNQPVSSNVTLRHLQAQKDDWTETFHLGNSWTVHNNFLLDAFYFTLEKRVSNEAKRVVCFVVQPRDAEAWKRSLTLHAAMESEATALSPPHTDALLSTPLAETRKVLFSPQAGGCAVPATLDARGLNLSPDSRQRLSVGLLRESELAVSLQQSDSESQIVPVRAEETGGSDAERENMCRWGRLAQRLVVLGVTEHTGNHETAQNQPTVSFSFRRVSRVNMAASYRRWLFLTKRHGSSSTTTDTSSCSQSPHRARTLSQTSQSSSIEVPEPDRALGNAPSLNSAGERRDEAKGRRLGPSRCDRLRPTLQSATDRLRFQCLHAWAGISGLEAQTRSLMTSFLGAWREAPSRDEQEGMDAEAWDQAPPSSRDHATTSENGRAVHLEPEHGLVESDDNDDDAGSGQGFAQTLSPAQSGSSIDDRRRGLGGLGGEEEGRETGRLAKVQAWMESRELDGGGCSSEEEWRSSGSASTPSTEEEAAAEERTSSHGTSETEWSWVRVGEAGGSEGLGAYMAGVAQNELSMLKRWPWLPSSPPEDEDARRGDARGSGERQRESTCFERAGCVAEAKHGAHDAAGGELGAAKEAEGAAPTARRRQVEEDPRAAAAAEAEAEMAQRRAGEERVACGEAAQELAAAKMAAAEAKMAADEAKMAAEEAKMAAGEARKGAVASILAEVTPTDARSHSAVHEGSRTRFASTDTSGVETTRTRKTRTVTTQTEKEASRHDEDAPRLSGGELPEPLRSPPRSPSVDASAEVASERALAEQQAEPSAEPSVCHLAPPPPPPPPRVCPPPPTAADEAKIVEGGPENAGASMGGCDVTPSEFRARSPSSVSFPLDTYVGHSWIVDDEAPAAVHRALSPTEHAASAEAAGAAELRGREERSFEGGRCSSDENTRTATLETRAKPGPAAQTAASASEPLPTATAARTPATDPRSPSSVTVTGSGRLSARGQDARVWSAVVGCLTGGALAAPAPPVSSPSSSSSSSPAASSSARQPGRAGLRARVADKGTRPGLNDKAMQRVLLQARTALLEGGSGVRAQAGDPRQDLAKALRTWGAVWGASA